MDQTVDLIKSKELNHNLFTVEEVQRMIAQTRDYPVDGQKPINIQINVGGDNARGRSRKDETGFAIARSKLFWIVVALSVSAAISYARTRVICQSFKDSGRSFYGMGVDRCIGVLIKQPFEKVADQLEALNRSY
ncbi:hypothetical protein [Methylobacterium thuringiense]|uniref:Uncharacterized protein n=1 Tax=Methylobacterium thuringiense TaxID=1003091 RepID=A0ABQ4TSF0_9HYPH|nr:hypothetical protein [Methylobacterium thuringiense]GJE56790.1 hypothetical protein EKPJFOCH_3298 [Methylobacterium thuringiense]